MNYKKRKIIYYMIFMISSFIHLFCVLRWCMASITYDMMLLEYAKLNPVIPMIAIISLITSQVFYFKLFIV